MADFPFQRAAANQPVFLSMALPGRRTAMFAFMHNAASPDERMAFTKDITGPDEGLTAVGRR
jgi:hypothetical protein